MSLRKKRLFLPMSLALALFVAMRQPSLTQHDSLPHISKAGAAAAMKQWMPATGPKGAFISALLADGADLFIGMSDDLRGGSNGVFRSTDQGESWTLANGGLNTRDSRRVYALGTSGPHLLAGTAEGIFLSADRGQRWTLVSPQQYVKSFITIGARTLAGGSGYGVIASTDQGRSWADSSAGINYSTVTSFAVSGTNVFAATSPDFVFRSTDEGRSWRSLRLESNLPRARLCHGIVALGAKVFVSGYAGIFMTNDQGETWSPVNQGLPALGGPFVALSLLVSGAKLLVGTTHGVFISTDEGQSWSAASPGMPPSAHYFPLARSGTNLFAGHSFSGGVFRSTDEGQSWAPVNAGLNQALVIKLVADQATLLAVVPRNIVYVSSDQGRSWDYAGFPQSYEVNDLAVKGATLLVATDNGVYRSADRGRNWAAATGFLPWTKVISLAVAGARAYAGTDYRGVFVSADGGQSWTASNNGLTNLRVLGSAASETVSVVSTEQGGLFVSTDGGQRWAPSDILSSLRSNATSLLADGNNLFVNAGAGVFRSADQGRSWQYSSAGIEGYGIGLLTGGGANLFGASVGRVYHSSDGGRSWAATGEGLPPKPVISLAVSGANVFATTELGGGIYGGEIFVGAGFIPMLVSASAASYRSETLAVESIAAAFGPSLATATESAARLPLPTELAGARLVVRDSAGVEHFAPLFFVSPNQINYQIPPAAATGDATVTATTAAGNGVSGKARIGEIAPGLFSADSSGRGLAAGVVLRIKADGAQSFEPVARFDQASNRFVAAPIDLSSETDQVFLILFGTGFRRRNPLGEAAAHINPGPPSTTLYAGSQDSFAGLDQVNVRLSRVPAGVLGESLVTLIVDNERSNTVSIVFR